MRTLHIISHTHWDREWYRTFQHFRLRLVHLVDSLLDLLDKDPQFRHFMLDGQTIVLDDYLHMRPEKETILRKHVQKGRILIGPWYVLPDMYLVSPESHIRNLLQGERIACKFGSKMLIGYIPDPFGHPAQMPQILRGFDIDVACLWRGLDDQPAEFWWQSPDGSRVLVSYMRDSYSNGASLPAENLPAFAKSISTLGDSLAAHSMAADYLIMLGTDHMQPPRNTSKAIAYADTELRDTQVVHSTLPAYFAMLHSTLNCDQLPVVEGELRACKRMHLLPGVLSTRMWIKQRNHASENLLIKWVEPFTTFQELITLPQAIPSSPIGSINQKSSIIRQTWRLLMENHAHDSICGCSIDQVHEEMKVRFDQVDQIGEELTRETLADLAAAVNTQAQNNGPFAAIVVFNPSAFQRTDVVGAEIELPPEATAFEIVDEAGNVLPHETLGLGTKELINTNMTPKDLRSGFSMINEGRITGLGFRSFSVRRVGTIAQLDVTFSQDEPDNVAWERCVREVQALLDDPVITSFHVRARTADVVKVIFSAPEIPCLGWRTFYIRAIESRSTPLAIPLLARALLPLAGHIAGTSWGQALITRLQGNPTSRPPYFIENEFFGVEVEPTGTLSVTDKRSGENYRSLNYFVDGGDCGDEYNYAPPLVDLQPVSRFKSVSIHRGGVHQTLTLMLSLHTHASLSADRKSRSRQKVEIPIKSVIKLINGVARVDIHTEVDNRAKDHRLRVHFPTPFQVNMADYDGHFEIVRRKIGIPQFNRSTWIEDPRPEMPQRAFIELSEGKRGLTVANRGLPEVEVLKSNNGTEIALTLLRCVGWLSRDDLSTRRGHAGPFMETPAAQMIGKWAFDYSICPYASQQNTAPYELAYAFETPLRGVSTSLHAGSLPEKGSFVTVHSFLDAENNEKGAFIISAMKKTEDGNGWLVRGYNPGRQPIHLTLIPFKQVASAALVNLAERKLSDLSMDKDTGGVSLQVGIAEIVTVMFLE